MAQTRYHIYRITFTTGTTATVAATDPTDWDAALAGSLMGYPVWLESARWETAAGYGREMESGRRVQLNVQHVAHVEKWSELR